MFGRSAFVVIIVFLISAVESSDQQHNLRFPPGGHLLVPCSHPPSAPLPFGVLRSAGNIAIASLNGKSELQLTCGNSTIRISKASCDSSFCNDNGNCRIANENLANERFSCVCKHRFRGRFCEEEYTGRWYIMWALWIVVTCIACVLGFAVFRHSRQSIFRSPVDHLRFVDILNGADY